MKLKLSILAGALALAVSAQANASVTASDLILSVWDTGNSTSYTLDTGITMATFTAGVTGTSATLAANSPASLPTLPSTNATLASYLSGISSADYAAGDVQWSVVATNGSTAKSGLNKNQELVTSNDTNIVGGVSNSVLSAGVKASIVTYAGAATNNAVHTGGTPTDPAYAGGNYLGANLGNNTTFSSTATLTGSGTSSLGFFYLTPSSTTGTDLAAVAQFGNTAGMDSINLSSAGTLSYTVAAVPEPSDWLLMLSGFGIVGFMVSRRNNQGSATLA